jgi:hypothetical protein
MIDKKQLKITGNNESEYKHNYIYDFSGTT